ncbi:MAG: diguanylate cyclase [Candidatus Pelethousia sp.]|nr:diguanylate cyclase [Candidatus Pelethousia sp.]
MAGDKRGPGGKPGLVFLACSLLFAIALVWLFSLQKARIKREIDSLVCSNLDANIQNRASEISGQIADTRNTLQAAADVVQIAGVPPEDARFQALLDQIDAMDSAENVCYTAAADLATSKLAASAARLLRGEAVVTDITYSVPLGGYYFYICMPVWEEGGVSGVISARVWAEDLTRAEPDGVTYKNVRTYLINSDGRFAFIDQQTRPVGDIFASMRNDGLSEVDTAHLARALHGQGGSSYQFTRKGDDFFVSIGEIGYNDWHLAAFLRGSDVLVQSDGMLQSVLHTSAALVLLTTGTCCVIYVMLLKDRRKLEREQRRYAMLGQFSDTVLFEYNRETDAVEFTSNAKARLCLEGAARLEDITYPDQARKLFHPDDLDKVREIFFARKEEGALYYTELRIKCQDGCYLWFGCQYRALEDAARGLSLVVGKLVDITDQRSREQALEESARRDILTGVYNKAGEDLVDELLKERPQGALIMLDVDRLKKLNDTYGHSVGDLALAELGRLLNETFRQGDIVARVGGDEFIVFLPGPRDPEVACTRTEQLLCRIRAIPVGDQGQTLSVSAGLALAPRDGHTYRELYAAADKAMYCAKQKCVCKEALVEKQ